MNLEQARYWYGRAAEQGVCPLRMDDGPHLVFYLGRAGSAFEPRRSAEMADKVSSKGHVPTMITLAEMYTSPNRIPMQPQLVFDLQRAAAQAGSHFAEFEVGRFYREGYLNAPDYAQAMVWFNRAAAAGYGPADHYLGAMYEAGQGVPADLTQARSHYERAAELGVSRRDSEDG